MILYCRWSSFLRTGSFQLPIIRSDQDQFLRGLDLWTLGSGVLPAIWAIDWRKRRRLRLRENSDICLKCGYDLRARQTAVPNAAPSQPKKSRFLANSHRHRPVCPPEFSASVEGKRKGSGEGAGGARGKLLGPYMVSPRPSCIAFVFAFEKKDTRFVFEVKSARPVTRMYRVSAHFKIAPAICISTRVVIFKFLSSPSTSQTSFPINSSNCTSSVT